MASSGLVCAGVHWTAGENGMKEYTTQMQCPICGGTNIDDFTADLADSEIWACRRCGYVNNPEVFLEVIEKEGAAA